MRHSHGPTLRESCFLNKWTLSGCGLWTASSSVNLPFLLLCSVDSWVIPRAVKLTATGKYTHRHTLLRKKTLPASRILKNLSLFSSPPSAALPLSVKIVLQEFSCSYPSDSPSSGFFSCNIYSSLSSSGITCFVDTESIVEHTSDKAEGTSDSEVWVCCLLTKCQKMWSGN